MKGVKNVMFCMRGNVHRFEIRHKCILFERISAKKIVNPFPVFLVKTIKLQHKSHRTVFRNKMENAGGTN
jgi:hypothetical protein